MPFNQGAETSGGFADSSLVVTGPPQGYRSVIRLVASDLVLRKGIRLNSSRDLLVALTERAKHRGLIASGQHDFSIFVVFVRNSRNQ